MHVSAVHHLFDAAAAGNIEIVRTVLDTGLPPNVRNGRGQTPLIVAARAGQIDVVRMLVAYGARLGARTDPLLGLSEPVFAREVYATFDKARASVLAQDVLQTNLVEGAVNDMAPEDAEAIELLDSTDDLLCEAGPLLTAAVCGHLDVVDALISAGAKPDAAEWSETPPLVGAAAKGHASIVERLLHAGATVDAGTGFTALEEAVVGGHDRVVDRLLDAGADVNRQNEDGGTPLMIAAATGRLDIVRQLVEAGADVNVVTDGEAALSCAASCGHLGVYAYLLPRSTAAVQAQGDIALGAYLEYVGQL